MCSGFKIWEKFLLLKSKYWKKLCNVLSCGIFFCYFLYAEGIFISVWGSPIQMHSLLLNLDKMFVTMDFQNCSIFQACARISPSNPSQFFSISHSICNASFLLTAARRVCSVPKGPRDTLWNNQNPQGQFVCSQYLLSRVEGKF